MAHSWKTCACGNRMANNAKTCQKCRRKPEAYICPHCGGPKSFSSKTCIDCRNPVYTSTGVRNRSEEKDLSGLDPLWVSQFVGWFHGEGSVRIHKTNKGTYAGGCTIKLRADDQAVLRNIHETLGGRFFFPNHREGHSPEVVWEITQINGLKAVLELIRDFTIIPGKKLQDVLIVLEFINWRMSQTYHGCNWDHADQLMRKLQNSRVFKLPDNG